MSKNSPETFTSGLVLPGGGARGAYQVGALKAIAEIMPGRDIPFSVISGLSVGAINAVALASYAEDFKAGVEALAHFWGNLHTRNVYRTDLASVALHGLHWLCALTPLTLLGVPNPRSLLNNEPLRSLLLANLDFNPINRAIQNGTLRAVSVTASSYSRGKAITFYQGASGIANWTRARREGIATDLTIDHVMAAAALPFMFPAEAIGNEYFGDGSLRMTAPLSPAIHTGADRIVVISSRDGIPDQPLTKADLNYPSLSKISGSLLDILFMDNVDADIERAQRIDNTLSLLPSDTKTRTTLRNLKVLVLRPSLDIRQIARQHSSAMPWPAKMFFSRFRMWGHDWRVPSYLMFEAPYCQALIDLGYRDTKQRSPEIARFLNLTLSE